MIRNKKDNEPVTQAALTRAEAEQILSGKRDQIYRCVMTAVVFFCSRIGDGDVCIQTA